MKNIKDKNNYLILCVSCILILITICYFAFNDILKGTRAGFGNACHTGCIKSKVATFLSNYPNEIDLVDDIKETVCENYIVSKNKFDVPRGYEFVGWNTEKDGSGTNYVVSSCVTLSDDIMLYAQWKEKIIDFGDLNLDGKVNNDDYLLLDKHFNEELLLSEDLLFNADVNGDTKLDEIDLDIIKHVSLGTVGYTGYLPKKIVPVYKLYVEEETESDEEVFGPGSNGHVSGNGSGNGENNTESGGGTNFPDTNESVNNAVDSNESDNVIDNKVNVDVDNKKEVIESKTYYFKFIADDIEYDNTNCTTDNSSTCKLVLPKYPPAKKGYKFNGWNLDKDCSNNVGINYSILVDNDATYYACFLEIEEKDNIYGIIIIGLLIFVVWVLAIYGIVSLIKRFKKTEIKN